MPDKHALNPGLFIAIDTNIFIRYVTQGRPGYEPEHWDKLVGFIDSGKAVLLVPEIVKLEFGKYFLALPNKFATVQKRLDTALNALTAKQDALDPEFSGVIEHLKSACHQWEGSQLKDFTDRQNGVLRLLDSTSNVVQLPFDIDVMLRERRNVMSGQTPTFQASDDADRFLIETVKRYFESRDIAKDTFLLCTADKDEFIVEIPGGKFSIHLRISKYLPPSSAFIDLKSLTTFIEQHRPVEHVDPAIIVAAQRRRRSRSRSNLAIAYEQLKRMESHKQSAENFMKIVNQLNAYNHLLHQGTTLEEFLARVNLTEIDELKIDPEDDIDSDTEQSQDELKPDDS